MARKLGLKSPITTHHIANMVYDVVFLAHDRSDVLIGNSPFLSPTLTSTEAQELVCDMHVWETHLAKGSRATFTETKQAAQLAQLALLWFC